MFVSLCAPQFCLRVSLTYFPTSVVLQRATQTIQEMQAVGVKPNVKTYTTLIHGWARASLPEKALTCFDEMKLAGLKPDKAVYHCLMTSLLSRAQVAEAYVYSGILSICREMIESDLTIDMGTAVHWSKCLRKIERGGGELTEALQKTFPPDWNLSHGSEVNSDIDSEDESDVDTDDSGIYPTVGTDNNGEHDDDDGDMNHGLWF